MSLYVGPTPERVAKASGVDVPIVDQTRRRQAFRMVDVVETMRRDGRLRDESVAAFRKFEREVALSRLTSVQIGMYGDYVAGGSRLVAQIEGDGMSPEERRQEAHARLAQARMFIGEPRTVEALMTIATEETSLEKIGRGILMIGNKTAAIAAAARTVQIGTYALAMLYGYVQPREQPG